MQNTKSLQWIILFSMFYLSVVTSASAVVSEVMVSQNGQPLANASVTLDLGDGNTVTETKTDDKGVAVANLPDNAQDQTVTAKVTKSEDDEDGTVLPLVIPAGQPWYRFAADTAGGIVGFTKQEYENLQQANQPITVGENGKVGSGAQLKQKTKETLGGLFGGAVGGMFKQGGFGMGPGSGGDDDAGDPEVYKDPISKRDKRIFTDAATGTKIAVGGTMTPEGLLVSTTILKSPDNGTFQAVYLQDPEGKQAGPVDYYIYDLYRDWKLSVGFTYDRWVDGKHVEHREGGWDESGRDFLGTFKIPSENDGIWKRSGFNTAVRGISALGAVFPISPEVLQQKVMNLVVHITRPSQDIVTTTPFVLSMPTGTWQGNTGQFVRPF